jgi:peptidoglycan/LPS O-acetylase OafA/YrhL
LGFVVLPFLKYASITSTPEPSNLLYYLTFFANFDLIRIWPGVPDVLPIIVLWSVAVEEQFYLMWPVFLKYVGFKSLPYLFIGIVLITLIFRSFYTQHNDYDYSIRYFHTFSVIGDMAIGGLVAYYCFYKNRFYHLIVEMPRFIIILIYFVTFILILFKEEIFYDPILLTFERAILSLLFALIIAEQNFSKNSFYKFSNFKLLSKMGIYTYGLYCLQFVGILTVQKVFDKINLDLGNWIINFFGSLIALAIVIIMSVVSYQYFEKYFLKKKDKFSVISKN